MLTWPGDTLSVKGRRAAIVSVLRQDDQLHPTTSDVLHKVHVPGICCLTPSHVALLQVEKGATAAVFGLGTIGLAVVDALATVGASRIIGVDTDVGKHARAKEWGVTDVLNPKDFDKPIQARPCSMEGKGLACLRCLSPYAASSPCYQACCL